MRRLVLRTVLVACALALAAAASADAPTRVTRTRSGVNTFPAGTLCDFNYRLAFTVNVDVTFFSDGRVEVHSNPTVAHTNADTGYTLTEEDHINITFSAAGTEKDAGIFWHLQDANGKLVVVHAGQITFDSLGNVVKFTPNSGPDFRAVLCPALGGHPA